MLRLRLPASLPQYPSTSQPCDLLALTMRSLSRTVRALWTRRAVFASRRARGTDSASGASQRSGHVLAAVCAVPGGAAGALSGAVEVRVRAVRSLTRSTGELAARTITGTWPALAPFPALTFRQDQMPRIWR